SCEGAVGRTPWRSVERAKPEVSGSSAGHIIDLSPRNPSARMSRGTSQRARGTTWSIGECGPGAEVVDVSASGFPHRRARERVRVLRIEREILRGAIAKGERGLRARVPRPRYVRREEERASRLVYGVGDLLSVVEDPSGFQTHRAEVECEER